MNSYIKDHPLNEMLAISRWNNVPIPVKDLFKMVCDSLIGQDVHMWERKSLTNQRLSRV